MNIFTSKTLIKLIANKHSGDLFIPECKTGASQRKGCLRMDAWAMKNSWANPMYTAYEVKVSRSDFINDTKWPGYLKYCNKLYFVTPPSIIEKDEVPPDVGLMICSKNAKMLYTKKKAPYRDVDIPIDLLKYIMMWRMVIGEPYRERNSFEYWKNWLSQKEEKRQIGYMCSTALSKKYTENVDRVDIKNKWLNSELEKLKKVKDIFDKLHITDTWNLEEKIKEATMDIPPELLKHINVLANAISEFKRKVEKNIDNENSL